ncbi:AAA family ATPase [Nannocystis pusilla]|uniref:AAA family ATPase n=1 Tax=Nannocystis pusilla TaxID=889268 RepID=A0A9X3EZ41_9BACT|nr:AAA family ATPase [Nannocystis pusilla]
MLIQFVVENFRSFRDETVFSMRAATNVERAPGAPDLAAGSTTLRCAALYGANASGKSNFVKALRFARDLVVRGVPERGRIPTQPFRLDSASAEAPSRCEIYLRADSGQTYGYGFAARADAIVDEWLSWVDGDDEREVFSRSGNDFTFSPEIEASVQDFLRLVSSATRDNQLFLRTTREFKRERFPPAFQDVMVWFEFLLVIIEPDAKFVGLIRRADEEPAFRAFLDEVLVRADTGISSVRTERTEVEVGESVNPSELASSFGPGRAEFLSKDGATFRLDLRLRHGDSPDAGFGLEDESDGTVRLLELAPMLFLAPKTPRVFVVDEMDRSMHTTLTRWLVERFVTEAPGSASQLVFTTHDTNLLDLEVLRPDAIWFAEKDASGASSLFSLAEFKREQIEQLGGELEQGYLNGRFGAIPFLGGSTRLAGPQEGQK